ncbi:hypothetical protein NIIDMKKI_06560 [Mycobacterium kansasii]|uniref:Uncharacterized protein n=1 Tax=Mycobacterium kansasii TaxID=1768 RepID=A0A7G1I348_MYCKA|nr:hypothetical protein NIIDMKKI_06560 [Mycobacterium kansasii]
MGSDGTRRRPDPVADRFVRYGNRDNTVSASLKNQAIVVETSAYRDFETFATSCYGSPTPARRFRRSSE